MIYEVRMMEMCIALELWSEAIGSAYLRSEEILDSLARKEETARRTFQFDISATRKLRERRRLVF